MHNGNYENSSMLFNDCDDGVIMFVHPDGWNDEFPLCFLLSHYFNDVLFLCVIKRRCSLLLYSGTIKKERKIF